MINTREEMISWLQDKMERLKAQKPSMFTKQEHIHGRKCAVAEMLKELTTTKIKAIRFPAAGNGPCKDKFHPKAKEVEVRIEVRTLTKEHTTNLIGETWLFITEGGSTGFESCCLAGKFPSKVIHNGWMACAGGGNWDGLWIEAEDLIKGLKELEWIT